MNGKIQFYKQTDEPRDSNPGSCCYGCTNASTMLQPVRLSTKIFVLVQSFLLSTYKMDTSFLVTIKCMCHSWCEMVMSDVILATFENGYVWCHHSLCEMVMSDVVLATFDNGYELYHFFFFLNGPNPASFFSLFSSFQYTVDSKQMFNI